MTTSEEQFRIWMVEVAKCVVGSDEPYSAGLERDYRKVWEASRAALLIELPQRIEPDYKNDYFAGAKNGYNQGVDECAAAIHRARVKSFIGTRENCRGLNVDHRWVSSEFSDTTFCSKCGARRQ